VKTTYPLGGFSFIWGEFEIVGYMNTADHQDITIFFDFTSSF
jgi:hypothetical protein